ncbi:MAG: hypothetical protein RL196_680 [Actinomycetota bacterium]|jgi:hypothetical protein
MGFGDWSTGWLLLPFFSIFGIVLNVVSFKHGTKIGCSGLALGAIGFISTATGSWIVGAAILLGLGFMAIKPESAASQAARVAAAQAARQAAAQAARQAGSGAVTTDVSKFRATYDDDETVSRPAAVVHTPAEAAQEVAGYLGDQLDDTVQQIEEDFVQGRIDRDTYVMRRRNLLG